MSVVSGLGKNQVSAQIARGKNATPAALPDATVTTQGDVCNTGSRDKRVCIPWASAMGTPMWMIQNKMARPKGNPRDGAGSKTPNKTTNPKADASRNPGHEVRGFQSKCGSFQSFSDLP